MQDLEWAITTLAAVRDHTLGALGNHSALRTLPTPLLDVTGSLRVAGSFALGPKKEPPDEPSGKRHSAAGRGFLYVLGFKHVISDIMSPDAATEEFKIAQATNTSPSHLRAFRLNAVCPPDAVARTTKKGTS